MAHLQYFNYKDYGDIATRDFHYAQAVRIGDRIECSGQGGWDPYTNEIPLTLREEIAQTMSNVQTALKEAGLSNGWEHVYKVRTYCTVLDDESLKIMVDELNKWCPNHCPLWTVVGVTKLGREDMNVEIEVEAHVGEN